MHDNDKTMTSMKHNGKPIIDDEDTHVKSIDYTNILKRPTDFQTGDSGNIGQWKEEGVFIEEDRGDDRDENNSDREFSPISRNSPFVCSTNGLVAGKAALVTQKAAVESITSTNKNGNYRKELPEPLNSSHSNRYKTTDPNGNHGHVTTNHVTSSENQEPISISPLVAPNGEQRHEPATANSSSTSETPPQSQPPTIPPTEEGQTTIDTPDEQVVPKDSDVQPMETSETSPPTTHATPPQTSSEVTDVTMEDIEPGTTTPARTPENIGVALEPEVMEVCAGQEEGQEEMEVSISCTQEDSRPVSEANQEDNSEDKTSDHQKTSEETTASSSVSAVTPGNLRLEDAHKRLENDNITNTLSALSVESRTADMIRRLVYIRARLMKSSSRIEAKKQKIRAQRERRHIPGICDIESRLISENRLIESDNDTPDTDESDIEDVDFMNDKIGSEQRRIRHREKLEEDKNRKIESRRTWLLKQIKNCERKETTIESRFQKEESNSFSDMVMDEMEEQDDGHCARTRAFVPSSKRLRIKSEPQLESKPPTSPSFESDNIEKVEVEKNLNTKSRKYWHTNRPVPLAKTTVEKHSNIHRLDNSYHHMLSNPRSIPLSTRLSTVLHNLDPNQKAMELKKIAKRNERREKRVSNDKKRPKRNEDFENNIVVPSSSFISNIVMPKYKNIDTPGYRSDETSDQSKEDEDEDISHESYVRRHIKAEKQEKLRYYQSAIKKSRKRKKEQIDPRLASPKPESYIIRESDDLSCGYRKIEYPIPLSQVGELGYKNESFKKKKQKKQWRSSTTEGSGGLRLKLSLRKT